MAKFNVVGLDDLQERMLQKAQIAEEAVPEMLKAGGAVMQEAQKAEIRKMFRSRRSTGDLAASVIVSKIKERDKRLCPAIRAKEYASAPVVHGGEHKGG